MTKPISYIGLYRYFFPVEPVEPVEPVAGKVNGCVLVGTVGLAAFSAVWLMSVFSFLEALPVLPEMLIANDNTIKDIAKIQVPFSKKSPVFCTPIR